MLVPILVPTVIKNFNSANIIPLIVESVDLQNEWDRKEVKVNSSIMTKVYLLLNCNAKNSYTYCKVYIY